uniref:Putative sharpin and rbck1 related protein n=1 Tax=Ixodes ricinus TaxID=34613 RepID=V5H4T0_IXORI
MRPCLHLVCLTCVEEGARQSPTYLVRCPAKDPDGRRCQSYVNDSLLKRVLSDEMYLSHKSLMGLALQSCATEDCTGKFSVRHDMKTAKCLDCQKVNCIPCKAIHENKTCEEFLQELVARLDGVPLQNLNYDDDDDDDSRNEKNCLRHSGM